MTLDRLIDIAHWGKRVDRMDCGRVLGKEAVLGVLSVHITVTLARIEPLKQRRPPPPPKTIHPKNKYYE